MSSDFDTTDPIYLRTFAAAAREEGDEETAMVVERVADEIERLRATPKGICKMPTNPEKFVGITTDPEIFITVQRWFNGNQILVQRRIAFHLWREGKFSAAFFDCEIDAMMKEVG